MQDNNKTARVLTGTGPVTWSHNGQMDGIYDMNGNVWEWVLGLRWVNGEVQILADNNAADSSADLTASSAAWKAINAADGTLVTPDGSGTTAGTLKMDWRTNKWVFATTVNAEAAGDHSCMFKDLAVDTGVGDAAKLLLQSLALLPDAALTGDKIDASYGNDYFWHNNTQAERLPRRGGYWYGGSSGGVFSLYGFVRSDTGWGIGGRCAFVKQ